MAIDVAILSKSMHEFIVKQFTEEAERILESHKHKLVEDLEKETAKIITGVAVNLRDAIQVHSLGHKITIEVVHKIHD